MLNNPLTQARQKFIAQWGALGSDWGINRTQAQIHALLMISEEPLSTDQIMEELQISRGNANQSLRELINWGVASKVVVPGERKDLFEGLKDPWKIFATVSQQRKRREIDPALSALHDCYDTTKSLKGKEVKTFNDQMKTLIDFTEMASKIMQKVSHSESNTLLKWLMKMMP